MNNGNLTDEHNANGNGGRFRVSWNDIQIQGIKSRDLRYIVYATTFTITMVGLYFGAQAIAEIITAIRQ